MANAGTSRTAPACGPAHRRGRAVLAGWLHRLAGPAALVAGALGTLAASSASASAATPAYGEVAAIFASRCVVCHSGPHAQNGVVLDSHEAVLKGGRNGPVVVPGSARTSELVRRIRGERLPRMPMTGPPFLEPAQIALIEAWIDGGAPAGPPAAAAAGAAPAPATSPAAAPATAKPTGPVSYADVAPILLGRCVKCHVENGQLGPPPEGYVLRTHAQTVAAADRARVVPGQPLASELLRRIRGQSLPRMPLDGPPWLSDEQTALIERWIADGARDETGRPTAVPAGAALRLGGTLTAPGQLDGLRFNASGARIERGAATGATVELRGRVEADGSVSASRIRAR